MTLQWTEFFYTDADQWEASGYVVYEGLCDYEGWVEPSGEYYWKLPNDKEGRDCESIEHGKKLAQEHYDRKNAEVLN